MIGSTEGGGPLRVRLIGSFVVEGRTEQALGSRKGRRLLKRLALSPGPVGVDALVDAVWGDLPPARPADQLAVLVSRLRSVLGADRITRGDGGYQLSVDWRDVDEFAERTGEAARRLTAGRYQSARAAATSALALVRGTLLADEPDAQWAEPDRIAVSRLAQRAALTAAAAALAAGDLADAAELAASAMARDPYDEQALRLLLVAYAAGGRPAVGLRAYAEFRERLAEELGADPAPETEQAHMALLSERVPDGYLVGPSTELGRSPRRGRSELVGRHRELAALDEELAAVTASGLPRLVTVEGEAGMGKSSLLAAWVAGLPAATLVLAGRSDEYGGDLPLQPIVDAAFAALARAEQDGDTTDAFAGDAGLLAALRPTSGPG